MKLPSSGFGFSGRQATPIFRCSRSPDTRVVCTPVVSVTPRLGTSAIPMPARTRPTITS